MSRLIANYYLPITNIYLLLKLNYINRSISLSSHIWHFFLFLCVWLGIRKTVSSNFLIVLVSHKYLRSPLLSRLNRDTWLALLVSCHFYVQRCRTHHSRKSLLKYVFNNIFCWGNIFWRIVLFLWHVCHLTFSTLCLKFHFQFRFFVWESEKGYNFLFPKALFPFSKLESDQLFLRISMHKIPSISSLEKSSF